MQQGLTAIPPAPTTTCRGGLVANALSLLNHGVLAFELSEPVCHVLNDERGLVEEFFVGGSLASARSLRRGGPSVQNAPAVSFRALVAVTEIHAPCTSNSTGTIW